MRRRLRNEDETKAFAREVADRITPGAVIGLVGDLGAGKTAFVRHLAEALGVRRQVKSPTFILLQEFATGPDAAARGIRRLWHADAYRIEREDELWSAGLAEAAADAQGVTVVEWADRMPSLRGTRDYMEIVMSHGGGEEERVAEVR